MTEAQVTIRRMEPRDEKYVIAIDQKIVGAERAESWPQRVFAYLERYYPPISHVAEVQGRVVGFIIGDVRGWEYGMPSGAWIDIMGVDPDYQGRGLGRQLIAAFVQQCREQKIRSVHAWTRDGDDRLQRFFSSQDFRRGNLVEYALEV
ncbi:MAG: GNAT family N-acetyltransferase [Chloroflexi bacterium]|nr:GNAT family N-acetyltransferase [Chloroflexota bacterium]